MLDVNYELQALLIWDLIVDGVCLCLLDVPSFSVVTFVVLYGVSSLEGLSAVSDIPPVRPDIYFELYVEFLDFFNWFGLFLPHRQFGLFLPRIQFWMLHCANPDIYFTMYLDFLGTRE